MPIYCCKITTGVCGAEAAQIADVVGCRSKLELISMAKSTITLCFFIAIIAMQVSVEPVLFALTAEYEGRALSVTLFLHILGTSRHTDGAVDFRY